MPRKSSRKKPASPPFAFPSRAGRLRLELRPSPILRIGVPSSITSAGTAPDDELPPLAEWRFVGDAWTRISNGDGSDWWAFLEQVRRLPRDSLFRHNVAGDLPGFGIEIDLTLFVGLLTAASHLRGFTFTRKPVLLPAEKGQEFRPGLPATLPYDEWRTRERNHEPIRLSNRDSCFTTNLVGNSLDEADRLAELAMGPVVVVAWKEDLPKRTPGGRVLQMCPAELEEGTCATCGLCALPKREEVIAFRPRLLPVVRKMEQLSLGGAP